MREVGRMSLKSAGIGIAGFFGKLIQGKMAVIRWLRTPSGFGQPLDRGGFIQ